MRDTKPNPVLAEVIRNGRVESCHRGSAVVVDARGDVVFSVGDYERDIYPRSAIKFFQALPLIESGAADKFQLTDRQLALACASHNAEPMHVDAVRAWLADMGLSESDLENGAELPRRDVDRHALAVQGEEPGRAHQNCSGKHTGMLTVARHLGVDTRGYSAHDHPVQRKWMETYSELVELDIASLHWERDGCGMPAIMMPMHALARGSALYANPDNLGKARSEAVRTIVGAVATHPEMIAGTDRCCTDTIRATGGEVLVKTGAEAVYVAVMPRLGLGLALKIDDGSSRGSEVALGALLKKLGAVDSETYRSLSAHFNPDVTNSQGYRTGSVQPVEI